MLQQAIPPQIVEWYASLPEEVQALIMIFDFWMLGALLLASLRCFLVRR